MDFKNLVINAVLGTSLVFVGCGDDSTVADSGTDSTVTTDTPATDDVPATGMPFTGECEDGDCFFVANALDAPTPSGDGVSVGQNIDGEVTAMGDDTGCGKQDFTHPDGTEGVDNGLADLLPVIEGQIGPVADTILETINSGSLLITMEITGADSTEDDSVMLTLSRAAVPEGSELMIDGDVMTGSISAGQTFDIDAASLDPITVAGTISGGRVTATLSALAVPIAIDEENAIVLTVNNAVLSADITATGLSAGEIAGQLNVAELSAAIAASGVVPGGLDPAILLEGAADLSPGADGCEDMSVALTFEAIGAVKGATL